MCVGVCACVCVFFSLLISILYVNVRNALIKKHLKKNNKHHRALVLRLALTNMKGRGVD